MKRIGLTVCDLTLPFWFILRKAAEDKAVELGLKLSLARPARMDAAAQIETIEDLIRQKVDALIIVPVDSQGIVPAVEKANRAGIPVIAADSEIFGGQVACTVQTDNVRGAELAAEYIAERLGYKGKVINIQGLMATQTNLHRYKGLHNVLDRYPEIEIAFERGGSWIMEAGREAMAEALEVCPNADAVFAANDTLLLGALQSLKAARKQGQMIKVGFDALPQVMPLIRKGEVDASVRQFPSRMGAVAVEMAARILRGEDVPERVDTGVELITSENVMEAALEELEITATLIEDLVREREHREKLQQEIIEAQKQALRELSTPIVPITEDVIAMPLIGSIDTSRAQQIMEKLLESINHYGAEAVIIDITGVPVVDTKVADHLIQVTRAARLLGARCILVGISPEVAHTIVSLGVDLSGLITRSDLQSGIEYALGQLGRKIIPPS